MERNITVPRDFILHSQTAAEALTKAIINYFMEGGVIILSIELGYQNHKELITNIITLTNQFTFYLSEEAVNFMSDFGYIPIKEFNFKLIAENNNKLQKSYNQN